MKVMALGGAGAMGAEAIRVASRLPGVSEIAVVDRDLDAARRVAREVKQGGDARVRISAVQLDVTDGRGLWSALSAVDVVLNTVGPYYRFGLGVLSAAIESRTHYLDICDDWEPTLRMLELDARARAAGVCAVIGMGASPGVSNLLAAAAARELDCVSDVYTAWPVDGPRSSRDGGDGLLAPDGEPSAAAVHWMQQISGTVAVVRRGRLIQEAPLRATTLTLPGGRTGTAYTVGHPEPATLLRTLVPTGNAVNLMVVSPGTAAYLDVLRTDIDRGRLTNESAAASLARPSLGRGLRSMVRATRFASPGSLPPFFAAAVGLRDGRRRTALARLVDDVDHTGAHPAGGAGVDALLNDMAKATGIPLALGLSQLLDGAACRSGVHPPDAVIDSDRFFGELAATLKTSGVRVTVEVG